MNLEKDVLSNVVVDLVSKYKNIFDNYKARMIAGYSDQNNNLSPNIDKYGRLHAPTDGYAYSINGSEQLYNKGEFLPEIEDPLMDDFMNSSKTKPDIKTKRILILESQKALFEELNIVAVDYLKVSFGNNSWYDKNMDAQCLYAYMSGTIANMFYNEIIETQNEKIKQLKEDRAKNAEVLQEGEGISIKGQIVSANVVEDQFLSNSYNIVFKEIIDIKLDNGCVITGSLTKKMKEVIPEEAESIDFMIGKKIEMIANIKTSSKQSFRGYYKSPKQIQIYDENNVLLSKPLPKKKLKV